MATSAHHPARTRGVIPFLRAPTTLLVIALGSLIVFYLIMRLLTERTTHVDGKLDIDLKNGRILINTHGEKAELVAVIKQLFDDAEKTMITRVLLRDLHGLYTSEDPLLAAALEKLPPDHPVSRGLRDLVKRTKGPFGGIHRHVRIDASSDHTLTGIIAASCTDSDFQGESLLIQSERRNLLTLNVSSQPFLCPHPPDEPIVRVSLETYRELFGSDPQQQQTVVVSIYPFQPVAFVPNSGEHTP